MRDCERFVHDKGIYHLDLKPANLLLKRTESGIMVKIIDFCLSRVTTTLRQVAEQRSRTGLTVFGQAMFGTAEYAPPEQRGYASFADGGIAICSGARAVRTCAGVV
ncbi:MAG: hypothetical protein ABFS56_13270 [Pseudomonadota bacterium]